MRASSLGYGVLALVATAVAGVDGRLVLPFSYQLNAFTHQQGDNHKTPDLEQQIASYYRGSGFPHAGRSLAQKVAEADAFLAREVRKSNLVGVGVSVVYEDKVAMIKGYGSLQANDTSKSVSPESLFQIGSVSKTMIAIGIALLVDAGKLAWTDPVKKHLPWFKLADPYMEKHLTVGDLLAMNSGFGRRPDASDELGSFVTERDLVEVLQYIEPEASLREKYAYSNTNYAIVGQVIEGVSGKPWHEFLKQRVWEPLGMNRTFASVDFIPSKLYPDMNAGHLDCVDAVAGPFDIVSSPKMKLTPREQGLLAAGSIVSTPSDMTKFMRLLLNKGDVGGVQLFQSKSTIAEMIRGKAPLDVDPKTYSAQNGFHFESDGNTAASGYGFDTVGQIMWGRAYYDKGGDTSAHELRTGFAPANNLGVAVFSNTESESFRRDFRVDQFRSYIMGIFLDVPTPILEFEYARWARTEELPPPFPGATPQNFCLGLPTALELKDDERDQLVGTYESVGAPKFFPRVKITRDATDKSQLFASFGRLEGKLILVAKSDGMSHLVILAPSPFVIVAEKDADTGRIVLDVDGSGEIFRPVASQ
ncbi:hypothetical protein PINS_up000355 [Pythium insidiosum]|nr:hypothetical protein PINS_up000355 [Pythium insidiosum]